MKASNSSNDLFLVENVTLIYLGPGKTNFIVKIKCFLLVFNRMVMVILVLSPHPS